MRPNFSEFMYGFALSYEIMSAFKPTATAVPIFPSLIEEKKSGYDVAFTPSGWPLFLQFKIAEYLRTSQSTFWSSYNQPYYRFMIYRLNSSDQHNKLKKLTRTEPDVYYVAPGFHNQTVFDQYFHDNAIFANSAFIPVHLMPELTDNDQHYVTFTTNRPNKFEWHSEEQQIFQHPILGRDWVENVRARLSNPIPIDRFYFLRLYNELVRIIDESSNQLNLFRVLSINDSDSNIEDVIGRVRYLLATHFDLQLFILRRS